MDYNVVGRQILITLPPVLLADRFCGTVELYRPSAPEFDRELPLAPKSDGTQSIDASKLAPGPWLVRVKWNAGGEAYFLEQKIKI